MTERQIAFFRELLAPFPKTAYYNVRGFAYVKSQTIENRLDDVAGPLGWTAEFTETKGGYKCRLKINCPDHTEEGWAWHYKENGAGAEDMVKSSHGETIPDEDNSEKSAYTNAFKRAASKWGFGRDLYNCGMPQFLDDLYPKHNMSQIGLNKDEGYSRASDVVAQTRREPTENAPPQQPPQNSGQRYINLNPPTNARQAYPWIKNLEKHLGREILPEVNRFCKENFNEWKLTNLDEQQILNLATWIMGQVRTWPQYDGCFDATHESPAGSPMMSVVNAILEDKTKTPRGNVKRAIIACAKAVVFKQLGREATESEQMAFVGEIGAEVPNGMGMHGEVLMSLLTCTDDVWLGNILNEAKKQMLTATPIETVAEVAEEPPF